MTKQGYVYEYSSQQCAKIISSLSNIIKLVCGGFHFLALDCNGNAYSWGKS